jgi:hypothetical protein
MALISCPSCTRHVRSTERACPFCDVVLPEAVIVAGPPVRPHLSRAAMLLGMGAVVAAHAACSSQPVYGASVGPVAEGTGSSTSSSSGGRRIDAGSSGSSGSSSSSTTSSSGELPLDAGASSSGTPLDAALDAALDADADAAPAPPYGVPPDNP